MLWNTGENARWMMLLRLILLLTVVPVVELVLLLEIHRAIADRTSVATGLAVTIGSIVLTGILGASLARAQGLGVIRRLQEAMAQGQFPGDSLIDGALILVGASMLLTPGFLTDLVGLSFLIPLTRKGHRRFIGRWIRAKIERGEANIRVYASDPRFQSNTFGPTRERVIDVTPDDERGP